MGQFWGSFSRPSPVLAVTHCLYIFIYTCLFWFTAKLEISAAPSYLWIWEQEQGVKEKTSANRPLWQGGHWNVLSTLFTSLSQIQAGEPQGRGP